MSLHLYRVVCVDDSEDDILLLQRALRGSSRLDLAATLCDGIQAIAYLNGQDCFADRSRWPVPDLLVLDIKMPNLDGFGVLEWLAGRPRNGCKVVVLTSSLAEVDRKRALGLGVDAVYVKPPDPAGYRALARMLEAQVTQ